MQERDIKRDRGNTVMRKREDKYRSSKLRTSRSAQQLHKYLVLTVEWDREQQKIDQSTP